MEKTLLGILAVIPTLITAYTGYLAYNINSDLGRLDRELKQRENQQTYDLKIYEAVKESLKGNAKDQEVALALVVSVGEEPLRSALLKAFDESKNTDPDVAAQARSLQQLPAPTEAAEKSSTARSPWGDWDFDLFYCTTSRDLSRQQAEQVAQALQADGAVGRIRTRPLESEVNNRPGYRVNGYEVRRTEDEAEMADKLAAFAKNTLSDAGVGFEIRPTSQKTPWYISVFFCPKSGVAAAQ
jgi:hypothetical protein